MSGDLGADTVEVPGIPETADDRPLLVCLLGTDHHPFDRLVGWCDTLARLEPEVRVLVQHGASPPPRHADGVAFLGKADLAAVLREAQVAVCHGGPGLISDLRAAGLLPVVVARDPGRGEHVDGHQQRFVTRFASTGAIVTADDQLTFDSLVRRQLSEPRGNELDDSADRQRVEASVARFAALAADLMQGRPPRR